MPSVRVACDTSAIRTCSPSSILGRTLSELARTRSIEMYVPVLVCEELITGVASDIKLIPSGSLKLKEWVPEDERERVEAALMAANEQLKRAEALVRAGINEWLEQLGAERVAVLQQDTNDVFKRYFAGEPPFKSRKSRSDIPDAFIRAAIDRIAARPNGVVHAVIYDKALRKACAAISNVVVHESWASLFKLSELAPSVPVARFYSLLQLEKTGLLEKISEALGEKLIGQTVISNDLPDEASEAGINMCGEVDEFEPAPDSIKAISDHAVLVDVQCRMEDVLVDFFNRFGNYDDVYVTLEISATVALEFEDLEEGAELKDVDVVDIHDVEVTHVQRGSDDDGN